MTIIAWTLVFLAAIGFFAFQMKGRLQVIFKARRDDGRDYSKATWGKRLKNMMVYGVFQKKFFKGEQPAGLMHVIVFWGFTVLSLQVITMFTRGWFPNFTVPGLSIHGLGGPYGLLKDIFQISVMAGVLLGLYRWTISKPRRLFGILPAEEKLHKQSHFEAKLILTFIFTIMLSGFFYDAGRLIVGQTEIDSLAEGRWQPITSFIAGRLPQNIETAQLISSIAWWVHNLIILVFLNLLPRSKHFHIITAMANVFLGKIEPKG